MKIQVLNNLTDGAVNSFLSVGEITGAATVRVKNINSFVASHAVQIGKTGEERAEIVMLGTAAVAGTGVALTGTLRFDHPIDTPIYTIKYDQIVIKRSTAGTAGTAVAFTGSTTNITPDSNVSIFFDTSGSTSYAYKSSFLSSVSTDESDNSDWLTTTGFTFYSLQKLRTRVKNKLWDSEFVEDDVINDWLNEWLEKMNNTAIDVNQDYSLGSTTVAFSGTAETGTISDTDFKDVRRVWFTSTGSDFYKATKIYVTDFDEDQVFNKSHPYYYMYDQNVIGRKPHDETGTAHILFYKRNELLDSDTDELPVPMQSYTKSFVDYALSQAYNLDEKMNLAAIHEGKANAELEKFKTQISPRTKSGPQVIRTTEATSGNEDDVDYI